MVAFLTYVSVRLGFKPLCQPDLFDAEKPQKNSEKLMSVMDYINRSGTGEIWLAGQGIKASKGDWKMKQSSLSLRRTTIFKDISIVKF